MDQGHGKDPGAVPRVRGEVPGEEERSEEPFEDAFARIEAAVRAGRSDLGRLGFWRLLGRIKPDPELTDRWADVAGRIDATVFDRAVPWRFPVWLGNAALVLGIGVGAAAGVVAVRSEEDAVAGAGLIVAAGAWSVSVHGLSHWAVGRAAGIRFASYFFRPGQLPPRPGIKTDYATYLRADPRARARMHAAGALATKLAPFAALALYPASKAPAWAGWIVLVMGVGQIATDVLFSRTTGDWSRVLRERRVARERAVLLGSLDARAQTAEREASRDDPGPRPATDRLPPEPGSSGQPG